MTTLFQLTSRMSATSRRWAPALLLLCFLAACKTNSALYNPDAVAKTTELRDKTLKLMDKATQPYAKYKTAADSILNAAMADYEQQKKRKHNELSVQQWKLLLEDDAAVPGTKAMLPAFFNNWKTDGKLTDFYIKEKKGKIKDAFEEILKLEKGKPKKGGK